MPPWSSGRLPVEHPHGVPLFLQGNLRRVDVQLLGQLCDLGLEMGTFREELVTILEEEEEEEEQEEKSCVEEDKGPEEKQDEERSRSSYPAQRLPDFEMTI